ncbi:hypothetical protein [Streptomyces barringtoniae]|uniref:hypothetical protein n=1 Tax=Streptomyces barringtoniae TaxID=2892029 RepID=UPI001E5C82FA|nr:hypothetical protein [Streptomyces barringtoniae]MCC5481090.1 hypothetical protein [Streptomyces barringtoniae]
MTDTLHSQQAPVTPATLTPTMHGEASATERPARTRREHHALRLYEALGEHSGFTARLHTGTFVIARDGYVATGADRVRLLADATYGMFRYALDMLLTRRPRMRAIGAQEHEGRIDLEVVEMHYSPGNRTEHPPDARPQREARSAPAHPGHHRAHLNLWAQRGDAPGPSARRRAERVTS